MTRPCTRLMLALACLGTAALLLGCATGPPPPKPAYLDQEAKALQYRLTQLQATAKRDLEVRNLKREAVGRAQQIDAGAMAGKGEFLTVHRSYLAAALDKMLPAEWEQEGFRFRFVRQELQFSSGGIQAWLHYELRSDSFKVPGNRPVDGRLGTRLVLQLTPAGQVVLQVVPELLDVNDRHYRAARTLHEKVKPERFAGIFPPIPVPVLLPKSVHWAGLEKALEIRCDPANALVLPDHLILPFEVAVSDLPPKPSQVAPLPPEAKLPGDDTPAKAGPAAIPVGLTPEGVRR